MSDTKPVPIPLSQRLDDLRRGPLALAIWVLAAFGAWTLLERQADSRDRIGLAGQVESRPNGAIRAARDHHRDALDRMGFRDRTIGVRQDQTVIEQRTVAFRDRGDRVQEVPPRVHASGREPADLRLVADFGIDRLFVGQRVVGRR